MVHGTLRVELRFDLPARRRYRLLEAQAAHDPFHFGVDALRSGNKGTYRDMRGALEIGAVEAAQSEPQLARPCSKRARICASSSLRQVTDTR